MKNTAADEFEKYDKKITYDDVQSDLSHKLLKLRVSFEENVACMPSTPAYIVNFKLKGRNEGHVIILKGEGRTNETTKEWLTISSMKIRHLKTLAEPVTRASQSEETQLKLTIVNVDEWREMKDQDKLNLLHDMTRTYKASKATPDQSLTSMFDMMM